MPSATSIRQDDRNRYVAMGLSRALFFSMVIFGVVPRAVASAAEAVAIQNVAPIANFVKTRNTQSAKANRRNCNKGGTRRRSSSNGHYDSK